MEVGREGRRVRREFEKSAKRIGVPMFDRDWLVGVIVEGRLPAPFGTHLTPSPSPLREQRSPVPTGGGGGSKRLAGDADKSPLVARSKERGDDGGSKRARVNGSPLPLPLKLSPKFLPLASKPPSSPSPGTLQVTDAKGRGRVVAWVKQGGDGGAADDLPSSSASCHRRHRAAFIFKTDEGRDLPVGPGGVVELALMPWEHYPRVVEILSLWSEKPSDGQPRMMARAMRYYRDKETVFGMGASPAGLPHLFSSNEEVVVALQSMVRLVDLREEFVCGFHYDCEQGSITKTTRDRV